MIGSAGRKFRVVVVDDYEPMRVLIRVALEIDSRLVVVAEHRDGPTAISRIESDAPDLLIVNLSIDKALTLVGAAKRTPRGCRVVVYSAEPAAVAGKRAKDAGADLYVEKTTAHGMLEPVALLLGGQPVDQEPAGDIVAVVAHGLLNTLAVVAGSARTLELQWQTLGRNARVDMTAMLRSHMTLLVDELSELPRAVARRVLGEAAPALLACAKLNPELRSVDALRDLLGVIRTAVGHTSDIIADVVRGLPPEVVAVLDDLRRSEPAPRG